MFHQLLEYKAENGDCLVPNRYAKNPQLGSWVSTQRRQYKSLIAGKDTTLTRERAKLLGSAGFVWATRDPRHVPWEVRFQELLEFKKKQGDCLVPIGYKGNIQLSNWVSTQRQEYKLMKDGRPTRLTKERIQLLENAGFVWEAQRGGSRKKRTWKSIPTASGWDDLVLPGSRHPSPSRLSPHANDTIVNENGGPATAAAAATQDSRLSKPAMLSARMVTDGIVQSRSHDSLTFLNGNDLNPTFRHLVRNQNMTMSMPGLYMPENAFVADKIEENYTNAPSAPEMKRQRCVGGADFTGSPPIPTVSDQVNVYVSTESRHYQVLNTTSTTNGGKDYEKHGEITKKSDGIYDDASDEEEEGIKEFYLAQRKNKTSHPPKIINHGPRIVSEEFSTQGPLVANSQESVGATNRNNIAQPQRMSLGHRRVTTDGMESEALFFSESI